MSEPAYPTTLVPKPGDRVVTWLLEHPGSIELKCERLLDAQVKTAFVLLEPTMFVATPGRTLAGAPGDTEVEVAIDPSVQALITIECPFQGSVDVDWRYQSSLRNGDEEQVGDWTCPLCGETQEVTR